MDGTLMRGGILTSVRCHSKLTGAGYRPLHFTVCGGGAAGVGSKQLLDEGSSSGARLGSPFLPSPSLVGCFATLSSTVGYAVSGNCGIVAGGLSMLGSKVAP